MHSASPNVSEDFEDPQKPGSPVGQGQEAVSDHVGCRDALHLADPVQRIELCPEDKSEGLMPEGNRQQDARDGNPPDLQEGLEDQECVFLYRFRYC